MRHTVSILYKFTATQQDEEIFYTPFEDSVDFDAIFSLPGVELHWNDHGDLEKITYQPLGSDTKVNLELSEKIMALIVAKKPTLSELASHFWQRPSFSSAANVVVHPTAQRAVMVATLTSFALQGGVFAGLISGSRFTNMVSAVATVSTGATLISQLARVIAHYNRGENYAALKSLMTLTVTSLTTLEGSGAIAKLEELGALPKDGLKEMLASGTFSTAKEFVMWLQGVDFSKMVTGWDRNPANAASTFPIALVLMVARRLISNIVDMTPVMESATHSRDRRDVVDCGRQTENFQAGLESGPTRQANAFALKEGTGNTQSSQLRTQVGDLQRAIDDTRREVNAFPGDLRTSMQDALDTSVSSVDADVSSTFTTLRTTATQQFDALINLVTSKRSTLATAIGDLRDPCVNAASNQAQFNFCANFGPQGTFTTEATGDMTAIVDGLTAAKAALLEAITSAETSVKAGIQDPQVVQATLDKLMQDINDLTQMVSVPSSSALNFQGVIDKFQSFTSLFSTVTSRFTQVVNATGIDYDGVCIDEATQSTLAEQALARLQELKIRAGNAQEDAQSERDLFIAGTIFAVFTVLVGIFASTSKKRQEELAQLSGSKYATQQVLGRFIPRHNSTTSSDDGEGKTPTRTLFRLDEMTPEQLREMGRERTNSQVGHIQQDALERHKQKAARDKKKTGTAAPVAVPLPTLHEQQPGATDAKRGTPANPTLIMVQESPTGDKDVKKKKEKPLPPPRNADTPVSTGDIHIEEKEKPGEDTSNV